MNCTIDRWRARGITSDSGRRVVVVGEGVCRKSGITLTLKHGNPGTNPDPKVLVLDLDEKESIFGNEVITPARVSFESAIGKEVIRINIRASGGAHTVDISG